MVPRSNAKPAKRAKAKASTEGTPLTARDVVELGRGVAGLRGMAKNGIRLNAGLRIAQREAKTRFDHADALEAFCLEAEVRGGRLPAKLSISAAVALGTVRRDLEKLKKAEEGYTLTPTEIASKIAYLDKIGEKLGEQLTLVDDEDDEQTSILPRRGKRGPAAVGSLTSGEDDEDEGHTGDEDDGT